MKSVKAKLFVNDNQEFLQFLDTQVAFCAQQNFNKNGRC